MKALVLEKYNQLVYKEVPQPEPGGDEVLIRVHACGICGSDVHGLDGSTGRRIPPLIMGHEAAGIIAATGANVTDFAEGDRVTFDSTIYCGSCFYCRRGAINLCDHRRVLGVSCGDYRQHGAFAEYVAVPERILHALPHAITFEQAAMVEPAAIAVHAIERTPISINDTAVVVGAGMIGLMIIQILKVRGCGQIIAIDIATEKLELARQLGVDLALDSRVTDVVEEVKKLTGNRGADVVFEAVGLTPAIQTALACVRKGGALTLVGNLAPNVELPLQSVVTREITLYGSCASRGEYSACLAMMARGDIEVDFMIRAVAPLSEGASWFQRMYDGEKGLMKVILRPQPGQD